MPFSIGIIGLGRMAQAILTPLLERGDFKPDEVLGVVGQRSSVKKVLGEFSQDLSIVSSDNPVSLEVWNSPIQLLAVKPQQLNDIKEQVSQLEIVPDRPKPVLISILAGVNLKRLQSIFPAHNCVRAVPNIPVIVRSGLTGLSWGAGVTTDQRLSVEAIFKPISEVLELPEKQLDAFLALTSSGPAYVAVIAEALADGAVAAGLPRSLANDLSNMTLAGSAKLLKESNLHPGELKDMVASPAGTTITALRHLEMAGIRSALIEAVVLAAERSRELGC
ncbi:pyrroline-5-carboxylate reductase [Prochlorococcus marinus]|uniref:Pyrroline-5-carboxylate reductase n=1 Tax=Prochlorococcus marinus (strain MIT 9211) TaxID=93059 RepID=A9BE14_PROM4|nr:pyrroline-5-carboxylate reductase [Prochlorococcus marinus]ABX08324.1 Delta 1-pyrroline-5-carboxylate reductase [Prochlorococcus marinus str. MIT 9211]